MTDDRDDGVRVGNADCRRYDVEDRGQIRTMACIADIACRSRPATMASTRPGEVVSRLKRLPRDHIAMPVHAGKVARETRIAVRTVCAGVPRETTALSFADADAGIRTVPRTGLAVQHTAVDAFVVRMTETFVQRDAVAMLRAVVEGRAGRL